MYHERMKKIGLSLTVGLIAFALIALFKLQPGGNQSSAALSVKSNVNPAPAVSASALSSSGTVAATPTPAASTASVLKHGSYTGLVAFNGYGPVQVSATISGGKLTDVRILQLPSDHRSIRIANYATPTLIQEAISAQSASIDYVSGATATSDAFMQSLDNALNQAKV
jgi:uncharacterized protein with FMN-binding domain